MTALTVPLLVIGVALTVPVYAFGVRRLLGLRLPLLRTLVAGVIAVLVASPIITAIIPKKPGLLPALWFVILGYAIALLAGMTFLVVAEVFVPSGSLPGPVYFARGLRKRLGRARRYSQISRILVRRGLLPYLRGGRRSEFRSPDGRARLARPLRLALEKGGVTFVKLGQVLATRRDLLPEEFVTELSGLQDDVAPVPWAAIDEVIRGELGADADELTTSLPILRRLPRRIDRISAALETGRLGLNVRLLADDRDRQYVTGLVHRILVAFLAATSGIMAVLMLGLHNGPHMTSSITLYQFLGYCLLAIAAVLALRVLVAVLRPGTT